MAAHENELQTLSEQLDADRQRALMATRDKIAERKRRKLKELRRKQEADLTKEMLMQKKELDEIRGRQTREAEQKAMQEGIKENGVEDSDKVVRAVMAQRHAQEQQDLEKQYAAEKKIMVDDALGKLNDQYDRQREELAQKHEAELKELQVGGPSLISFVYMIQLGSTSSLQKQKLSPEEYRQRRAQLLNKQQLELAELDRRQSEEQKEIERGALTDWEVRYARAKLDLKERHYKVG